MGLGRQFGPLNLPPARLPHSVLITRPHWTAVVPPPSRHFHVNCVARWWDPVDSSFPFNGRPNSLLWIEAGSTDFTEPGVRLHRSWRTLLGAYAEYKSQLPSLLLLHSNQTQEHQGLLGEVVVPGGNRAAARLPHLCFDRALGVRWSFPRLVGGLLKSW